MSDEYEVQERAAIKEFDGNMSREVAEKQAIDEFVEAEKRRESE